jgi:hypothetical protein
MGHVLGNIVLCKWKWGKSLFCRKKPNRKMAELMEINSGNVERSKFIPANLVCLIVQTVEGRESAKGWME